MVDSFTQPLPTTARHQTRSTCRDTIGAARHEDLDSPVRGFITVPTTALEQARAAMTAD